LWKLWLLWKHTHRCTRYWRSRAISCPLIAWNWKLPRMASSSLKMRICLPTHSRLHKTNGSKTCTRGSSKTSILLPRVLYTITRVHRESDAHEDTGPVLMFCQGSFQGLLLHWLTTAAKSSWLPPVSFCNRAANIGWCIYRLISCYFKWFLDSVFWHKQRVLCGISDIFLDKKSEMNQKNLCSGKIKALKKISNFLKTTILCIISYTYSRFMCYFHCFSNYGILV
jgi:hypothetical protein